MNDEWRPIRPFHRRELLLNLPPGSGCLYCGSNNMTARFLPSCLFPPIGYNTEFAADDVLVVGNDNARQYTLVGAVTAHRSQTFLLLVKKGGNLHSVEVRQPDIRDGEPPEEVVVLQGDDWRKLLVDYAALAAARMGVQTIAAERNLTGYCTWYYYYADVTESDLLENLEAMQRNRDTGYAADVIQIDDGYQAFQGDWLAPDPSWPTPLPEIARRIAEAGMTAGIWLMPFQASTASRVFREHPDWFVQDVDGTPKVAAGWSPAPDDLWACLDTTQPAVREHLAAVFRTFRSWGFNYFKLDGLGFGLMEGTRSDPAATPVSAFRLGLEAIRHAVPEAWLLGCCPPFLAGLGYLDSARITSDTRAAWPSIQRAMQESLSRWWMFDRFFRCDPDVLMARQDRAEHTPGEARISILTGILTGITITSDNLATIAPDRLALLGRAASIRMRQVFPVQRALNDWLRAFSGTVDGRPAAAVFNDSEEPLEFAFEQLRLDPREEADERLHPLGRCRERITVAPHDAVLLVQKPHLID